PENDGDPIDDAINNPNDEDDHDIHIIGIYDLALRKTVDNKGPYALGETAVFRVKVYNQGNVPVQNVVINDYIRSGFSFNASANPGWAMVTAPTSSAAGLLNYNISSVILPGDSTIVALNLIVALDENPSVEDWWNYAEVRSAQDLSGLPLTDDADSTPNSNSEYENDVLPDSEWDDEINGNGPSANEDEDDHDPESIIVVGGLGDTVWKDLDGDGIQDTGEPGVSGVTAYLSDCEGNVLQTTVTNSNGFYFFYNLVPGYYRVRFDISNLAPGCAFTFQNQGTNDTLDSDVDLTGLGPCVFVSGGVFDSTYDAGLLMLSAIGNFVWHDLNGDGLQSSGEPGIPGVQVKLYKGDGSFVGTTTTDQNGFYLFDFLYPGDYYLEFVEPNDFDRTFTNVGSNDAIDSDVEGTNGIGTTRTTTLSAGERDLTWDAGYYKCIPIGDLVWYDINKNDIWDSNENGINGLIVNLWRNHNGSWIIWETTLTGQKPGTPSDDGYWKFCAPPGQYYVEVIMPPLGLVRTRPNIGDNEEIDSDITNANGPTTTSSFTVVSGQMKCDLGAGFYPQATAGSIVWIDANNNGAREEEEERVEGVKVEAVQVNTGEIVRTAYTDTDGVYMIDGLEKQDYFIRFAPPIGYGLTTPRASLEDIDSDVDGSNGPNTTRTISMQPAQEYKFIDMGLVFGVLPLSWLDVSISKVDQGHNLVWRTTNEVNVSHFEVERMLPKGIGFEKIGSNVPSKGVGASVQSYNLVDSDLEVTGRYIYRVKQVDNDGRFTYSKLVSIEHKGEERVSLYPNPAITHTNIEVLVSEDSEVKIELYDATSKLVQVIEKAHIQNSGLSNYKLDLTNILNGTYNVKVIIDGRVIQKKLIVLE
ncbi:MAG TPA: SdrD B-like domain-containing protein, partial [Saprospiraceae bacterium]|nr:SdrD B-like domain-containing protein [Saprospiraceae bacterium]